MITKEIYRDNGIDRDFINHLLMIPVHPVIAVNNLH